MSLHRFVWRKKIERDVSQGQKAEIEKVKKRREERAIEKTQHEEEMTLLARERACAEFQDWEKKEEEFHFDQSKVRSEIRLREGRTKPIDVLQKNLNFSDEFDIELNEPYLVFKVSIICSSLSKCKSTEKSFVPAAPYLCNFLYVF